MSRQFVFLISVITLVLFFAANAFGEKKPWLRIGYITDLTGRGAFFGVQSIRGAQLAQMEVSAPEHKIEIIYEDIRGQTSEAVSAALHLINKEEVDAIMCDLTPPCTAISPRVKAANKVLIYQSPSRLIGKDYNSAYRNFIDYLDACQAQAVEWKKDGYKDSEIGSLMPNLEFGELCLSGISAVMPEHTTFRYNPGDDLRSAALQFYGKNIKAVFEVGYEPDFLNWFQRCADQRFSPQQGFVELMLSKSIIESHGKHIEGAAVAGFEPMPEEFVQRLNEKVPGKGDFNLQGAALAYNGVKALVVAFKQCPDKSFDCVNKALRSNDGKGGLLGFKGWKADNVNGVYPVRLKKFKGGTLSMK